MGIIRPPKGDFENCQVLSCLSVKEAKLLLAFIFFGVGTSFGESAAIQSLPLQNVPFYEGI